MEKKYAEGAVEAADGAIQKAAPATVADDDAKRAAARLKAKESLIASLAGGDFSNQQTRVAHILNLHPAARNSDVALALKYWETFQPELYNPDGIKPADFFKLDRVPFLVRARAKIQNEYELFRAEDKVRRRRKGLEDEMREAVLTDEAPRQTLQVFSDETGKGDEHVIIGSVWVLNGRAVYDVTKAIKDWQAGSKFAKRELHFSAFGKGDMAAVVDYLNIVAANREFLSFKLIAMSRRNTRRPIEEVVQRLHEFMLVRGLRHEIESGRVGVPRHVAVTMDEEQSIDRIVLAEMRNRVADGVERARLDGISLDERFNAVSSKDSALVQLADVIAGAANRRLSFKGERNYKDEIADRVMDVLGLQLEEGVAPGVDAAVLFRI
ncbi:DUF3800 domain-containing protein [Paraburkholderia sp. SOS3]|uniref:DUF3800 domain-containing protein n=1 Tax=Paraburkholderia sp. SOS3 TaxID=1926494 RepID=UPI0009476A7B|nr:DUF3800 domain-containing protein [Paraburkholderia sp. SOS3]APR35685.1 hypothetical protein BTO02_09930 [Paraburkholderia sp. SOS3]